MDMNGRVHPNCVNASNPYHECGVSCLERIAQGKGRNKKKIDYGGGVKEGGIGRKKDEERRVHPFCSKASNPYHECTENCIKRVRNSKEIGKDSGSKFLEVSRSFGREKKESESQPKPHQLLDNGPALSALHPAKAPSSASHVSSEDKEEVENGESYSSSEQSGDIYSRDHSFDMEQDQSFQTVLLSGKDMPDYCKVSSKNSLDSPPGESPKKQEKDDKYHETPILGDESRSFSFSGIARSLEDSDDEEIQSVISDSCVSVGKYHVRASVSSVLQSIIDKHGDIAADCQLESVSMRAYYLECLCSVVQELQSTSFDQLTKSKVREMLAVLKDVESAKLRVDWLRGILNELAEAIDLNSQNQVIQAAKAKCIHNLESTRKRVEVETEDLAHKEQEVEDAKARVAATRARLSELELECSLLNKAILTNLCKLEKFQRKPNTDELF